MDLVKEAKCPEGEVGWESLKDQPTYPEDLNRLHLPRKPSWRNRTGLKLVDLPKAVKCPEEDLRGESQKTQVEPGGLHSSCFQQQTTELLGDFSSIVS